MVDKYNLYTMNLLSVINDMVLTEQQLGFLSMFPTADTLTTKTRAGYNPIGGTNNTNVIYLTRRDEKTGTEITGYNFIINVEKSRYVKEKSKIPISVSFDGGIQKYSGLVDIAIDGNFISKPSPGWYAKIDRKTGEIGDRVRFDATQTDEFWKDLLNDNDFKEYVKKKYEIAYKISSNHGMTEGPDFAAAEWMSGWISLSFLNDPLTAKDHFQNFYNNVNYPISTSRGAYWLARSYEKLGDRDQSNKWYQEASKYLTFNKLKY